MIDVVLLYSGGPAPAWLFAGDRKILGLVTIVGAIEQQGSCFLSAGTVGWMSFLEYSALAGSRRSCTV